MTQLTPTTLTKSRLGRVWGDHQEREEVEAMMTLKEYLQEVKEAQDALDILLKISKDWSGPTKSSFQETLEKAWWDELPFN